MELGRDVWTPQVHGCVSVASVRVLELSVGVYLC
jgi:hypothetical protein